MVRAQISDRATNIYDMCSNNKTNVERTHMSQSQMFMICMVSNKTKFGEDTDIAVRNIQDKTTKNGEYPDIRVKSFKITQQKMVSTQTSELNHSR